MTRTLGRFEGLLSGMGASAYLAVSCFFLVGMRQNNYVPLSSGLSIGQFLLFAFVVGWIVMRLRGYSAPVRKHALTAAVLGWLVAVLLSYGAAMGRGVPSTVMSVSDHYVLTAVASTTLVLAVAAVVKTSAGLLLVVKGLLLGGWLSAAFAIIEFGTGIDLSASFRVPGLRTTDFVLVENLMREGVVRSQGSAGHPLELAAVLTTLIPLGVGVIAAARARGERMWPWLLCTATLAAGALVTVSRVVLLGLLAALGVMAWRWSVGRMALTLIGVAAAGILAWLLQLRALSAITSTVGLAMAAEDPSLMSRTFAMQYVASHYQLHFWLGQGVGTYPIGKDRPILDSEYLSKLMEGGALGLIAYALLFVVSLTFAIRAATNTSVANAEIASGIAGAIAVVMVVAAVLDIDGFAQYSTLVWVIIALTATACYVCRQPETAPSTTQSPSRTVGTVLSTGSPR